VTKVSVVANKILCAGPKHFDQLKSEPGPNRKAQPDLQLCAAVTTLKMAGDAIVTFKCLWRNYGDVVWCYRTRKFLVFNHAKLPEIEYESPVYSNALCNNIFVRIWIFLSTSLKKTNIGTLWTPRTIFVVLSNCVSRDERIISEKQRKKSLGWFLMNSKVWKLNSMLSAFCCVVSRPTLRAGTQLADIFRGKWLYVTTKHVYKYFGVAIALLPHPRWRILLRVVIKKMKILQNLTFCFSFFWKEGVWMLLYFCERAAIFKKVWEPMQ